MLLQGMEGGWVVIEASHTVGSGLNVICHMLNNNNNMINTLKCHIVYHDVLLLTYIASKYATSI